MNGPRASCRGVARYFAWRRSTALILLPRSWTNRGRLNLQREVEKAVPPVSPFKSVLSNDLLAGLGYEKRLHGQTAVGCIMEIFVAADTHNLMACFPAFVSPVFALMRGRHVIDLKRCFLQSVEPST